MGRNNILHSYYSLKTLCEKCRPTDYEIIKVIIILGIVLKLYYSLQPEREFFTSVLLAYGLDFSSNNLALLSDCAVGEM
jgi:hypothetical protein